MPSSAKETSNSNPSIAQRLEEQRKRARDFLGSQRERLNTVDRELTENLNILTDQTQKWVAFQDELSEAHLELQSKWDELSHRETTLKQRDSQLADRETALRQSRLDLAERIRRNRDRSRESQRASTEEQQVQVAKLRQELSDLQNEFEQQQRDREGLLKSHEEQMELQSRLEAELNSARGTLAEQRNDEKQLRQQLARSRTVLNERAQQITDLRNELEKVLKSQEDKAAQQTQVDVGELMAIRRERDELHEQLAALQQAQQQLADNKGSESDFANLQHRYDILVEKLRDLKNRNTKLESELKSWRGGSTQPQGGQDFDWEKQKRRMLNQLEGKPVEETVAEGAPQGEPELPPGAFAEQLESEREKLQKLQEEWHEKLRSAEVEISVERAENARLRSQLQGKMREVESKMAALEKESEKEGVANGNKPRRRWMDRLGLSGDDES